MKTFSFHIIFAFIFFTEISPLSAQNAGPIYVLDRFPLDVKGGCFCTEYVAYRIRGAKNKPDFKDAKFWGSNGWLSNNGYVKQNFSLTTLPQNKDVIIIHSGWGISSLYGHVGFVGSSTIENGTIKINVIGANQYQPSKASKCGCNNESNMPIQGVKNNDARIEIWRKSNPALACP